ncbi:hypothetical protein QN277_014130 [Acacia crassicarpa]|uniref:Uncharacterized protein n=1 Tax=Acacia crassicarpa TaxID=499986 RepID=A0AAE1TEX1_9FABA|nr:hypothetical protein QN277_014130 [Acacia crassicarpa]
MARPVPICFVGPLPASPSLSKGRRQLESALGRLTRIVKSCYTAQKVLGPFISSDKGVLSVNLSCHRHSVAPPSFIISETQPLNLVADYCTNIVISGYWVGPDIDDGWGFVEAIINQVT